MASFTLYAVLQDHPRCGHENLLPSEGGRVACWTRSPQTTRLSMGALGASIFRQNLFAQLTSVLWLILRSGIAGSRVLF